MSGYHFEKLYNLSIALHEIASDFKALRGQPGQYSLGGYIWEVDKRLTPNHKRYILGTFCVSNLSSPAAVHCSLSMRRLLANVEQAATMSLRRAACAAQTSVRSRCSPHDCMGSSV